MISEESGGRTHVVVLDKGDEAVATLGEWATREKLTAARVTAIGGFRTAKLGFFDPEERRYAPLPVDEQAEVLSLVGDIALVDDAPQLHAHVVLGLRDGSTRGGHLLSARVFPTLEVMVTDTPAQLHKSYDPETGLVLIDPSRL